MCAVVLRVARIKDVICDVTKEVMCDVIKEMICDAICDVICGTNPKC